MRPWAPVYLYAVLLVVALKAVSGVPPAASPPTPSPSPSKEKVMAHTWNEIKRLEVPARPQGLWTLAIEYVEGPVRLRVQATGSWMYSKTPVDPDGDAASPVDLTKALVPAAPVGALVAKVGGSTAGIKEDGKTYVVGRSCLIDMDDKVRGPLYLTMNDLPTGFASHEGKLMAVVEKMQP